MSNCFIPHWPEPHATGTPERCPRQTGGAGPRRPAAKPLSPKGAISAGLGLSPLPGSRPSQTEPLNQTSLPFSLPRLREQTQPQTQPQSPLLRSATSCSLFPSQLVYQLPEGKDLTRLFYLLMGPTTDTQSNSLTSRNTRTLLPVFFLMRWNVNKNEHSTRTAFSLLVFRTHYSFRAQRMKLTVKGHYLNHNV